MNWVRESWRQAKREPVPALAFALVILTVLMASLSSWFSYRTSAGLTDEFKDRIQMSCEMAFANGQALLDSVTDVDPEVVEKYRRNLQRRTNEVIQRYDPGFDCKIPEENTAS